MRHAHLAAVIAAALSIAGGASAQTLDMKGTWKSTGEAIVSGSAAHHPPGSAAQAAGDHRLRKQSFTIVVQGQDGKRFWGDVVTDAAREPFVGSLSHDGKWIYTAGRYGLVDGSVVDNDTIQSCYRQVTAQSFLVGCSEWKRQK